MQRASPGYFQPLTFPSSPIWLQCLCLKGWVSLAASQLSRPITYWIHCIKSCGIYCIKCSSVLHLLKLTRVLCTSPWAILLPACGKDIWHTFSNTEAKVLWLNKTFPCFGNTASQGPNSFAEKGNESVGCVQLGRAKRRESFVSVAVFPLFLLNQGCINKSDQDRHRIKSEECLYV